MAAVVTWVAAPLAEDLHRFIRVLLDHGVDLVVARRLHLTLDAVDIDHVLAFLTGASRARGFGLDEPRAAVSRSRQRRTIPSLGALAVRS